jgi:hypothetical protein
MILFSTEGFDLVDNINWSLIKGPVRCHHTSAISTYKYSILTCPQYSS